MNRYVWKRMPVNRRVGEVFLFLSCLGYETDSETEIQFRGGLRLKQMASA